MSEDLGRAFREESGVAGGCPDNDFLWDSARGALPRDRDNEVLLHLAACGACAAAWRVAREMGPPAAVPRRPILALPVAAAAILVAGLGIGAWLLQGRDAPTWREPAGTDLESLAPPRMPRDRVVLAWTGGPEGTTYDLRVTTEDLAVLAEVRHLERPEHALPAALLAAVPPGGTILWQVGARRSDGRRIESGTFRLVLD